jgi:hypothetical protein
MPFRFRTGRDGGPKQMIDTYQTRKLRQTTFGACLPGRAQCRKVVT